MFKEDEKLIAHLVKEYSMLDILTCMSNKINSEINHLSDMGLKERVNSKLIELDKINLFIENNKNV